MEPLTKIELSNATWLGLLAIACAVVGELLTLADNPEGKRASFVERETARSNKSGLVGGIVSCRNGDNPAFS